MIVRSSLRIFLPFHLHFFQVSHSLTFLILVIKEDDLRQHIKFTLILLDVLKCSVLQDSASTSWSSGSFDQDSNQGRTLRSAAFTAVTANAPNTQTRRKVDGCIFPVLDEILCFESDENVSKISSDCADAVGQLGGDQS